MKAGKTANGRTRPIGVGLQRYTVAAKQARPSGWATIRFEFACDGGGIGNVRTELTDEETADRHEEEPAHKLAALKKPRAG